MPREPIQIRKLYAQLLRARPMPFPLARERLAAPNNHGVYIIYGPRGTVLHVGRTVRGAHGLRQRLNNHLHGNSSFTIHHFSGQGSKLRGTHKYAFVEIPDDRTRALLESLAIGCLCPKHLGVGAVAA